MSDQPLVLIGSSVSNYVNVVRAALLEKGVAHRHDPRGGPRDPGFLTRNPMGKVPVLETETGPLAETVAILDYLDDRFADMPLRPADPYARARMRQAINVLQVYVEVPARVLYPHVFAGGEADAGTIAAVRGTLDRAIGALRGLLGGGAFLGGSEFSQLDAFAFHTFELVDRVWDFVWGGSLVEELGLGEWHARIASRPSSVIIRRDFMSALSAYLVDRGASLRARELFADA